MTIFRRSFVAATLLILVLACAPQSQAQLAAHVAVAVTQNTWTYTASNDESQGSTSFVSSFAISVSSPIIVTETPLAWNFTTDNISYVFWFNTDTLSPYINDISPGASLGRFSIQALNCRSVLSDYNMQSWDHFVDQQGPNASGMILSPQSEAGEPSAASLVNCLLPCIGIMIYAKTKHKVSTWLRSRYG